MFATPTNESAGTIPNIGADDNDFAITTGNIERMRIDSNGRVTIGTNTTNSSDRFTIVDPGNAFMSLRSDAAADNTSQNLDFGVGTGDRSSSNLTGIIAATIHSQSGGTLKSDLKFPLMVEIA